MEHIYLAGISHHLASIAWRERVALTGPDVAAALGELQQSLAEVVILSTCNRTEVYAVSQRADAPLVLSDFFARRAKAAGAEDEPPLALGSDCDAIAHLLQVACGLESMVLGECEILGQVRQAHDAAAAKRTIGPVLSALFQAALRTGKRARSETGIARGAASLAYAAVQLARQQTAGLRRHRVLLVGAGEMGQRVAKNLRLCDASALVVANRSYARAVELAQSLRGQAIHFDGLPAALADADVVISATGAPHQVLSAATVAAAMQQRPERPLLIVDIALPRDVDPQAEAIPGVALYQLDHLQEVTRESRAGREEEAARVRRLVAEEQERFCRWLAERRAGPLIAGLHSRAEEIRSAELERALRRLGHLNLSPRDRNVIEALSSGIVNKLLAPPTLQLKARVQGGDGDAYLDMLRDLWRLEGTPTSDMRTRQEEG